MEQFNQILTLEDFIITSENLYLKLSKNDREYLLSNEGLKVIMKIT